MPNSPVSEKDGAIEAPERDLEAEIADLDDRFKRARADLENYRKRSEREFERRVTEARDAISRDWLDVVDSVERGLRVAEPENPMAEGFRHLLEQMEAILDRYGISRFGAVGEPFDPELHEAVGVRESDESPDMTVVEVVRSGYAAGDRVLRPAQVVVARKPTASAPEEREG
jgi:molecular chaperone GrpE